jgi:hypothetical protein
MSTGGQGGTGGNGGKYDNTPPKAGNPNTVRSRDAHPASKSTGGNKPSTNSHPKGGNNSGNKK